MPEANPIAPSDLTLQILTVRGQRVLLDETLASLYGSTTGAFNQAVRRNRERFPTDFLFELKAEEWGNLRSQIVTLRTGHGRHRKYLPLAFTEHGATMAAMVLNTPRAVQMSVYVVRAFVRFRRTAEVHAELAKELGALKRTVASLGTETRREFDQVYEAILGLMSPTKRQ